MLDDINEQLGNDKIKFVDLWFTDIFGTLKNITVTHSHFQSSVERGIWFDGSSIEGFARIQESDMILMPDISTYAILPWTKEGKKTARFICDVLNPDGTPFEGDPRYILKRQIKEAADLGLKYDTGPEIEFFLFGRDKYGSVIPVPHDIGGYFDASGKDLASEVRNDISLCLEMMGIDMEAVHHEVAPGQHEIDFKYDWALQSADKVITAKQTIKIIAQMYGLYATFMPKPVNGENGSGMHVHQSLKTMDGKSAFYNSTDKYKLSNIAKNFIEGQLTYAKNMIAILAPTVNSYKRLVPGYEAPINICWGQTNRSVLIRIPRYSPGREQSTRCELRCPDPSANPYLAFAVMLGTGLVGIQLDLNIRNAIDNNSYNNNSIKHLPECLKDALDEMSKRPLIENILGKHTFKKYITAKNEEWISYKTSVTDWEINEYLDSI